jgi:hypothetical protein
LCLRRGHGGEREQQAESHGDDERAANAISHRTSKLDFDWIQNLSERACEPLRCPNEIN